MSRGFTLLETLLYLVILSILIVAGVASAYAILDIGGRGAHKIVVASEGNFLIRKIDWALSGATAVVSPSTAMIDVTKAGTTYTFEIVSGKLRMTPPGINLSSDNVIVSGTAGIAFTTPCITGKPKQINITLDVNGTPFSASRYLRASALCP